MVEESIEDRTSDHRIAEDFPPRAEALITGQQDRAAFVATTHQLEKQIRALAIDRDVPDLIDDEQFGLGQ